MGTCDSQDRLLAGGHVTPKTIHLGDVQPSGLSLRTCDTPLGVSTGWDMSPQYRPLVGDM